MNDFLSPVYSGKSPPLSTYIGSPNSSSNMLGSIISGVGSLANGVINAIQGNKNNKRQIEFAKWSQQQQERFAWDMFRAENRYNDPSAQAERLLRAGLNPALMYGSGVGSTGEASGGQTLSAVQPNTSPVPSFLQNLVGSNPFQSLSALLEAEKVKADVKKTGAETKNIDQATINALIDEQLGQLSFQKEKAAQPYYGKAAYNDIMKRINENEILVQTSTNLAKQGKLTEAEEKMNDALTDWYKIQHDYKEAQLPQAYNEIISIINANNSGAAASRAAARNSDAQASYYTISSKDKLADYYRKIDDAIELYLDEHDNIKVDKEKLQEVKDMMLKQAKNAIREQNQNYWNPFHYVGQAFGGSVSLTKKVP